MCKVAVLKVMQNESEVKKKKKTAFVKDDTTPLHGAKEVEEGVELRGSPMQQQQQQER